MHTDTHLTPKLVARKKFWGVEMELKIMFFLHGCSHETGNFTGPNDLNLIVAKCNRLVIYLLTPEGLQPVLDTPIYGATP